LDGFRMLLNLPLWKFVHRNRIFPLDHRFHLLLLFGYFCGRPELLPQKFNIPTLLSFLWKQESISVMQNIYWIPFCTGMTGSTKRAIKYAHPPFTEGPYVS
jgi:hypothetical protein